MSLKFTRISLVFLTHIYCLRKSLENQTQVRSDCSCSVLVRGVRAREFQIFLSLFNVSVICHSTYENVTSYVSLILFKKIILKNQRSNTGLRVRNSFARFRIGVVPMKSLCMHLEYPLMRQLSYFTPLRFVMLRGIQHVLVLRYVV